MKTITIQLTVHELDRIYRRTLELYKEARKETAKHWYDRTHFYGRCVKPGYGHQATKAHGIGAANSAYRTARLQAMFEAAERDGLAHIHKEYDHDMSWEDIVGDSFNPDVNDNIDPEVLAQEEREYRDHVDQVGVWWHRLDVKQADGTMDEYHDCIGGFVGDDFYGSGHDGDFYQSAVEHIDKVFPGYFAGGEIVLGDIEWEEAA